MSTLRMLLYLLGAIFNAAMAMRMAAIRTHLANLFGLLLFAYTANGLVGSLYMFYLSRTGAMPSWGSVLLTVNAGMICVASGILFFSFPHSGGGHGSR